MNIRLSVTGPNQNTAARGAKAIIPPSTRLFPETVKGKVA
jgi:hypothetical protein